MTLHYLGFSSGMIVAAMLPFVALLGGCSNDGTQGNGLNLSPVKLFASNDEPTTLNGDKPEMRSVKVTIDRADVKKAINRYRIAKKIKSGSEKIVGADLNGNGMGEALVYFQGDEWCISTGCYMVIFAKGANGFRQMTEIKRVKFPVLVALNQTNGWRDLIVNTGNQAIGVRSVALKFNGNYPVNATTVKERLAEIPQGTEILLAEDAIAVGTN